MAQNNKGSEEIDLLQLLYRAWMFIVNILTGIFNILLELLKLLLRRWLVMAIGLFIGLGLTYISTIVNRPYYESDITLRTNVVPNSELIPYINKLHKYCLDKNTVLLEAALSESGLDITDLKDIEAFWLVDIGNDEIPDFVDYKDKYRPFDTLNVRMADRLNVRARVYDPGAFEALGRAIVSYINSNPLFQNRNDLRLAHYNEKLDRMVYDIYRLDSLQDVKYFEETRRNIPAGGGQIVFMQEQTTQLLYNDIIWLMDEVQEIDKLAEIFGDIVTPLVDFTPVTSPKNSYSYYALRIVPAVLLLTILFLLLVVYRKDLLRFIKS
ncbi:MAG: hypothetical protein V2I37_01550 [Marinilabiliaceae bacterium]|jgi:hypothetical protein|nr:hypothetical protein [Marinilabiliaceae bacterium]